MTHENSTCNSTAVVTTTNILHEYWVKIVYGETDVYDIRRIRCALYAATKNQAFSRGMAEFLGKNGTEDMTIASEMRIILGNAMVKEFLQSVHPIIEWTQLLAHWQVFDSFERHMKEEMISDSERCVQAILKVTSEAFEHSECLVIGGEKERYLHSVEQWQQEDDIQELWSWGAREWYPYEGEAFFIPKLLLPRQEKTFLELADLLKSPVLLYELLAGLGHEGVETWLSLLRAAPATVDNTSNMRWNKSWVAPVLLDELVQQVLEYYSSVRSVDEHDKKEIEAVFIKTGEVLSDRSDGLFLAWNYIRCLYSGRRRNPTIVSLCVNALGGALHKAAQSRWPDTNSFKKLFSEDIVAIRASFRENGILKPKQECSAYMKLLACIQFFVKDDEYVIASIPYLEASFMFEDDNIQAYAAHPQQCHFSIADMYLTAYHEKAVDEWMRMWELFAMARYRSQFDYYDKKSIVARRQSDFLLLVALAFLKRLFDEGKWESVDRLWEKLWGIMENRMQFKWSASEDFNKDYIRILFQRKPCK